MRRSLLLLLVASPLLAQQQQGATANAAVSVANNVWMMAHGYVLRAAEQVPESLYSFKPTPEVRSLGAILGHIADAERMLCIGATGGGITPNPVNEKKTGKAEIVQALKDAAASCAAAYAQPDAATTAPVDFFGMKVNRMFTLQFNGAHTMEHYGNIVTYMRMKGLTPPSSQ
jgi:uncharacterized damage-inducible protein DinB